MNYHAVITGDIVHSRKIGNLQLLLAGLNNCVNEIERQLDLKMLFETYRGDSFQLITDQAGYAMNIAVLIRAKLKSITRLKSEKEKNIPLDKLWDARLSIGIGLNGFPTVRVSESTGEAFVLSGKQLDEMKNSSERMRLTSNWESLNEQFAVIIKLGDAIISRWTYNSAEAAYRYLLYSETQKQISEKLGISQPAVHNRLSISNIDAIEKMLHYLNKTIKNNTNGN